MAHVKQLDEYSRLKGVSQLLQFVIALRSIERFCSQELGLGDIT
jgi:hypothetical protein